MAGGLTKGDAVILVTGATGNVGRCLVDALLERDLPVRALTRRPQHSGLPEEVEVVGGDLSTATSMAAALDGVDAAFLNPQTDPGPLTEVLATSTVDRVVLLSALCVTTRSELAVAQRLQRTKQVLRDAREDLVVLQPGQFMTNALHWQSMIAEGCVEAPFADVAVPLIDPADVAEVAAVTLTGDVDGGADFDLTGSDAPSPRQMVATIARELQSDIAFVEQTEQQFRDTSSDIDTDLVEYLIAMRGHPTQRERRALPTVAELTGREPRSFTEWVIEHLDDLR